MGKTFAEKVLERKAHQKVHAGDCVIVNVDVMMASDTTGPLAIKAFERMGGKRLLKKDKTVFILDHATPCPNERIAALADRNSIFYLDINEVTSDETGNLNPEYTWDEVHLLGRYNVLWTEYLSKHGILKTPKDQNIPL